MHVYQFYKMIVNVTGFARAVHYQPRVQLTIGVIYPKFHNLEKGTVTGICRKILEQLTALPKPTSLAAGRLLPGTALPILGWARVVGMWRPGLSRLALCVRGGLTGIGS